MKSEDSLDIYVLAIGGTGMAPLACLLQERGHRVRGVDGALYPPMSTLLAEAGIHPHEGYDAAHLDPAPDLVIVGNAIRRDNPEAVEAERRGLPVLSMPEAMARFFLAERRPLVVTGTHGKTTTTAMASWVYHEAGRDPGYLVGGAPRDLPGSFHGGTGERFVIEGDEYNAAYFDRGAKFLHYRPETLIVTSLEYDHADLYPTPEPLWEAFAKVVALVPESGLVIACGDWPRVREAAAHARCRVLFYGLGEGNDLRPLGPVEATPEGSRFRVADPEAPDGEAEIALSIPGEHNLANALAVWAAARHDGIPPEVAARALGGFRGVQRRLEELGTARGVTVVDDFAHHPTAVGKTVAALRQRYPGRPVKALFEPRSLTAGRDFFWNPYLEAFATADRVVFAPIFHRGRLAEEDRLDLPGLSRALAERGVEATVCESNEDVLALAIAEAREGDVYVTMSSGSFDGMPRRLLAALAESAGR